MASLQTNTDARLGVHLFRRDFRLEDNTALNELSKRVDAILPVFIFDERQVGEHPYKSAPGLQMLCESLEDLNTALREQDAELHVRTGIAEEVLAKLVEEYSPVAVSYNKDYTPFALKRDSSIDAVCKAHNVEVVAEHDVTLHAPGSVVTKEGKPYSVYTHYRNAVAHLKLPQPVRLPKETVFVKKEGGESLSKTIARLLPERKALRVPSGRTKAKEALKTLDTNKAYARDRDFPAISATSLLSAHIKFGTLSIREIYMYAKTHMPSPDHFLREVLWHDFFTTVAALSPHVYEGAYRPEFNSIVWSTNETAFEKWKEGKTGFPIVDAGMRELKETGYMHNRVRMITASFLIKDLHINWQWGERYFATALTDYDPAVNNGNWQWVAGTGCDASPWFRIFNPWLQQKKFDVACVYIKKWVPELAELSPNEIHDEEGQAREATGYPKSMCIHKEEAKKTKELFGVVRQ